MMRSLVVEWELWADTASQIQVHLAEEENIVM